jgi:hypothetical protein
LKGALLTGGDAAAVINGRVATGAWWLFAICERRFNAFLGHLERCYYSGAANEDLEALLLPGITKGLGPIGIYLAKKTRMPAEALQREFVAHGGPIAVEHLQAQDVFFLHPNVQVVAVMAEAVAKFLGWPPRPGGS